eukprot:scaffold4026_cov117-Cylindrotheca_fusiformis.AAC.9
MQETYPRESTVSAAGAQQLVQQCVKLGLLHDSSSSSARRHDRPSAEADDDLETFRKLQKDPFQTFSFDMNCQLISSDRSEYYTREGLIRALVKRLDEHGGGGGGGRQARNTLCEDLYVHPRFLGDDSPLLRILPSSVQVMGTDLVSEQYWKDLREAIAKEVKEQGSVEVVKLANQHMIPVEVFLGKVVSKIDEAHWIESSNTLVSDTYMKELRSSVVSGFKSCTEPTLISKMCDDNSWDMDVVLEWLIQESKNGRLPGEVHVDATGKNAATALFLPDIYTSTQRNEVMTFIADNGFISRDRAINHGLSIPKIADLVEESYDDIEIQGDVLMVGGIVLQKMLLAVQVCLATGFVDLLDHFPAELVRADILQDFLSRADFSAEQGLLVMSGAQAVLVARSFVDDVASSVLPPLVQAFAKARAEEIVSATTASTGLDEDIDEESARSGKEKARSRKARVKKNNQKHDEIVGVVPLSKVALAMFDQFPNTPMTDFDREDVPDLVNGVDWIDEEDCDVLLAEFCKAALYTDDFRSQCEKTTEAEIRRLKSAKQSKATLSRKDEAAQIRGVERAFEEVFVHLCFLIQANAKFLAYAENSSAVDDNTLEALRSEMLQCYCADLTSRITQYCLFKNEDDSIFTFMQDEEKSKDEANNEVSSLPPFCAAVDVAARHYGRAYLSCPPPREPLPVLRESLSGTQGVTLARQWVLCGGETYHGGVRGSENDGSLYVRPGSISEFMGHVQENCLSLCGLPFKKLDKKSEKQFLFHRRQTLVGLLEAATDPTAILELTIMILFQQVKQLIVSGVELRGGILRMLREERKISKEVADMLELLDSEISGSGPVSDNLVDAVRDCGLCRDIAKHEVKPRI